MFDEDLKGMHLPDDEASGDFGAGGGVGDDHGKHEEGVPPSSSV